MPHKDPAARREYLKKWTAANRNRLRDEKNATQRRYYERKRDQILARNKEPDRRAYKRRYAAECYRKNPAKFRERSAAYLRNNPGKTAARRRTDLGRLQRRAEKLVRRARLSGAPGRATPAQIAARIEVYGDRCYICRAPWQHLDHVIPLSRGGSNWPANLRPACARCNLTKHARRPGKLTRVA